MTGRLQMTDLTEKWKAGELEEGHTYLGKSKADINQLFEVDDEKN